MRGRSPKTGTETLGSVVIDGSTLTLPDVERVARRFARVEIAGTSLEKVRHSRRSVERILKSKSPAYGINTGFGKLAETKVERKQLAELQSNLLRSHAVGTGEPLSEQEVRAIMLIRLNSLLQGYSGVRIEVIRILQEFLNRRILPFIPRYGSLGASGDLAPSAHLGLCMIGEGFVLDEGGKERATRSALRASGIKPVSLRAKEGLSIINGTQVMTAIGSLTVLSALGLLQNLDIAAAMSLEALGGSLSPFDSRLHRLRPMHGQEHVAARIQRLTRDSKLIGTAKNVQDPYSLRCIPQVHGAFYDAIDYVRRVIEVELNSVTDNPIVFPDKDEVVSGGNFHGQPVALALDILSLALAEISIFCERRIDKLLSKSNPDLPIFLSEDPGLNSGLMVTQYTAAALVAENRVLGTPAGLSNASVSAGQEDHASMGVTAALKAARALEHTIKVVAIEMLCACQALDLLVEARAASQTEQMGEGTRIAYQQIRKISPRLRRDRSLYGDLNSLSAAITDQRISGEVGRVVDL